MTQACILPGAGCSNVRLVPGLWFFHVCLLAAAVSCAGCMDKHAQGNVVITVENRASQPVFIEYSTYDSEAQKPVPAMLWIDDGAMEDIAVRVGQGESVVSLTFWFGDRQHTYSVPIQNAYVRVEEDDFWN